MCWNKKQITETTHWTIISLMCAQWHSKALRGPGSTVTFGPNLSLLSPLPPPSPFPAQPLHLPRSGTPNPARGLGERCKLPAGSGAEPQTKSNLVHFSLKIRHLVATILMIFLRACLKFFCGPTTGAPGAPVHWTTWTPGSYVTVCARNVHCQLLRTFQW